MKTFIPNGKPYRISNRKWCKTYGSSLGRWPLFTCVAYVDEKRAFVVSYLTIFGKVFCTLTVPFILITDGFKESKNILSGVWKKGYHCDFEIVPRGFRDDWKALEDIIGKGEL